MTTPRPGLEGLAGLRAAAGQRVVEQMSIKRRLQRVQDRWWLIVQCSVAAAAAWWIASDVFDKPSPFFAPVAAIISLGMSYGRRLRRTIEIIVGVAVGVGVGDAFVSVAGVGIWQIAVTVALALALAVFLIGAQLIVTQAGVQAVISKPTKFESRVRRRTVESLANIEDSSSTNPQCSPILWCWPIASITCSKIRRLLAERLLATAPAQDDPYGPTLDPDGTRLGRVWSGSGPQRPADRRP